MLPKQWILRHVDLREQMALASLLAISPLTASVLLARGISTKVEADRWLSPHQGATHPFEPVRRRQRQRQRLHPRRQRANGEDHARKQVDYSRDPFTEEHAVSRHVQARRRQDHAARPEHHASDGKINDEPWHVHAD